VRKRERDERRKRSDRFPNEKISATDSLFEIKHSKGVNMAVKKEIKSQRDNKCVDLWRGSFGRLKPERKISTRFGSSILSPCGRGCWCVIYCKDDGRIIKDCGRVI
jgi:hypothetical protein